MEDTDDPRPRFRKITICVGLSIVGAIVSYGLLLIWLSWPISTGSIDKAGVFGDSFGILTSLFSGLAFVGIVYTIFLQSHELELQRNELKETRKVLAEQSATAKHQNFESTFFQMLRLQNDIVNTIDISAKSPQGIVVTKGRDCITIFYDRLRRSYNSTRSGSPSLDGIEVLTNSYDHFWNEHSSELTHYFRYAYTLLKFVDESNVENKRLYTDIIKAQLSDQERFLIFYNSIQPVRSGAFKSLLEKYGMMKSLPSTMFLDLSHAEMFYANSAFE